MSKLIDLTSELNERGGVLIQYDGDFNAWLKLDTGPDDRLEVIWRQENYPALTLNHVTISDADLWKHMKATLGGFYVRKLNLDVPELAEGPTPTTVPYDPPLETPDAEDEPQA